tara:strand:+ start:294 stop:485 length:192 start_codon:yes stop_codon:yes gene_type:complete
MFNLLSGYIKKKFGPVYDVVDALMSLNKQFETALKDDKVTKQEAINIQGRMKELLTSLKNVLP